MAGTGKGKLGRTWFPIVLRELQVLRAYELTPGMRRVVLGGDELGAFRRYGYDLTPFRTEAPDDHVKLFFPAPGESEPVLPEQDDGHLDWPHEGPRPLSREYTPRRYDAEAGELELDFVVHAGGVAADWASTAAPGDRIFLAGPKMSIVLPEPAPEWYLLTGDQTALPAIGRWLDELDEQVRVHVLVEVANPDEEQKLYHPAGDVRWLYRDPTDPDALVRALAELDLPDTPGFAWAAGETALMRGVREHLRKVRGLPTDRLCVTGYWKRGVSSYESVPGE